MTDQVRVNAAVKISIQMDRYERKLVSLRHDLGRLKDSMTPEERVQYNARIEQ